MFCMLLVKKLQDPFDLIISISSGLINSLPNHFCLIGKNTYAFTEKVYWSFLTFLVTFNTVKLLGFPYSVLNAPQISTSCDQFRHDSNLTSTQGEVVPCPISSSFLI